MTSCSSVDDSASDSPTPGDGSSAGATSAPGQSDGPGQPGGSTDATPPPDAVPVEAPAEVVEETGDAVEDYVVDTGAVLEEPTTEEELTLETVTGAALEELRNRVAEYEASGWYVSGEPVVVRHRVVEYYEDPALAVVRACIDNSKVRVVDADGQTIPGSRPARPRTLNVLRLVQVSGDWVVAEQRPATRPDC